MCEVTFFPQCTYVRTRELSCRAVWMRSKWKLYSIYYTTLQYYRDAEFLDSVQNMKCLKEVPLINLLILSKVFVGSIKKGIFTCPRAFHSYLIYSYLIYWKRNTYLMYIFNCLSNFKLNWNKFNNKIIKAKI